MKFKVFEEKNILTEVGKGYQEKDGMIKLNINNKIYILYEVKEEQIKEKKTSHFENKVSKQIYSYKTHFKEEAIKKLSQVLNQHYQNIISKDALHKLIGDILVKYNQNYRSAIYAYIKYFETDGLLERKENNVFNINRNILIPKNEEEDSRGFLDELGMS